MRRVEEDACEVLQLVDIADCYVCRDLALRVRIIVICMELFERLRWFW